MRRPLFVASMGRAHWIATRRRVLSFLLLDDTGAVEIRIDRRGWRKGASEAWAGRGHPVLAAAARGSCLERLFCLFSNVRIARGLHAQDGSRLKREQGAARKRQNRHVGFGTDSNAKTRLTLREINTGCPSGSHWSRRSRYYNGRRQTRPHIRRVWRIEGFFRRIPPGHLLPRSDIVPTRNDDRLHNCVQFQRRRSREVPLPGHSMPQQSLLLRL